VVDTCVGNDKVRPGLLGKKPLSTNFLQQMADIGWTRDSVDTVVCTHLHVDHVGWNTMLEDGKWVATFPGPLPDGQDRVEHWRANDEGETGEILADSVQPILDAGLAELVDMDHVLSAEIRLIPTRPYPGHVSVMIESQGQTAVITGDMTHHPCRWPTPTGRRRSTPTEGRRRHAPADVRRMGRPADPVIGTTTPAPPPPREDRRRGVPLRRLIEGFSGSPASPLLTWVNGAAADLRLELRARRPAMNMPHPC